MNVDGSQREALVYEYLDSPSCLAYDWIHENLYWADSGLHSVAHRAAISVISVTSRWRCTLFNESFVSHPTVIVLDPRQNQGSLELHFISNFLLTIHLMFYQLMWIFDYSFIDMATCLSADSSMHSITSGPFNGYPGTASSTRVIKSIPGLC